MNTKTPGVWDTYEKHQHGKTVIKCYQVTGSLLMCSIKHQVQNQIWWLENYKGNEISLPRIIPPKGGHDRIDMTMQTINWVMKKASLRNCSTWKRKELMKLVDKNEIYMINKRSNINKKTKTKKNPKKTHTRWYWRKNQNKWNGSDNHWHNERISLAKIYNVYVKELSGTGVSGYTGHQAKINEKGKTISYILIKD